MTRHNTMTLTINVSGAPQSPLPELEDGETVMRRLLSLGFDDIDLSGLTKYGAVLRDGQAIDLAPLRVDEDAALLADAYNSLRQMLDTDSLTQHWVYLADGCFEITAALLGGDAYIRIGEYNTPFEPEDVTKIPRQEYIAIWDAIATCLSAPPQASPMPPICDWFVAGLRCPGCGTISPATSATSMQTHLRDHADSSELGVHARLDPRDVQADAILGSGYQLVARPEPGETFGLLEVWACPACGRTDNWAMIEICDALVPSIAAIEAVTLDRATLERAHFISDSCVFVVARLTDVPVEELMSGRASCVEVLREHLPVDLLDLVPFPVFGASPPPAEQLDALDLLLGDPDTGVAYEAAIRLCSWGRDSGARWLCDLLDGPDAASYLSPHRLWSYPDFDVFAHFAADFGRWEGSADIEAAIYRRLLAMVLVGDIEFDQHLPGALRMSRVTPDLVDELHDAVVAGLDHPLGVGLRLLTALAGVDRDDATSLIEERLDEGPLDSTTISTFGDAIAEMRDRAAWEWATRLANSQVDDERQVGKRALTRIGEQIEKRSYWWSRRRWSSINQAARVVGLGRLESRTLMTVRDSIWGTGDTLKHKRRLLSIELERSPHWDPIELRNLLSAEDRVEWPAGSLDDLLLAALGASLGESDAVMRLDGWLVRRRETARRTLDLAAQGIDGAGEIAAEAAFLYARQSGGWASFETIAKRMLQSTANLGVGVVFAGALLDAKRPALAQEIWATHDALCEQQQWGQASFLLPVLADLDPDRAWPRIVAAARERQPTSVFDTRVFAIKALHLSGARGRELAAEFVDDPSIWVRIVATDVVEGVNA